MALVRREDRPSRFAPVAFSVWNKPGECQKAASGDAAPMYNAAPVEAQRVKSGYDFLSEPKRGHAQGGVGGRIRRLTDDEAAYPS